MRESGVVRIVMYQSFIAIKEDISSSVRTFTALSFSPHLSPTPGLTVSEELITLLTVHLHLQEYVWMYFPKLKTVPVFGVLRLLSLIIATSFGG